MIQLSELQLTGVVRKTHGTHGELFCSLLGEALFDADPEWVILRVEGILVPFRLMDCRSKADGVLLQLEDVDSGKDALRYVGCEVYVQKKDLPAGYASGLSAETLVGFEVVEQMRGRLGVVTDVDDSTLNVLCRLDSGFVFPVHEDFVVDLDEDRKRLVVSLPEGLFSV